MATRKVVDCKDLSTGNKVFPRTHAAAVVMDDGSTVFDAINNIASQVSSEVFVINPSSSSVYNDLKSAYDSGIRSFVVNVNSYLMPAAVLNSNNTFTVVASFALGQDSGSQYVYTINSSSVQENVINTVDYVSYPIHNHGTSDTTFAITPNTMHVWGTVASLTITLASNDGARAYEYIFKFDSGSAATALSLPSDLKWNGGEAPVVEANKTYQISILNGLAVCVEFS